VCAPVDLPLSSTFCKLVLGDSVGPRDLAAVDAPMAQSVGRLLAIVDQLRSITADVTLVRVCVWGGDATTASQWCF
jgi:hypothetical protein